jgi:predicted ATPase
MAYLIERSFFNEHGLLVIAARPEEHNPDLERLLSSLHASSLFVHVPLDQLSLAEVADLARFILGQEPTPEFVHQLAKDTGGNPLFILETLRAVLEQSLRPDLLRLPASLPLAGSIHALVRGRLRALSQPAAQALTAAALVGNAFDVDLIEKANRMEPEQVAQALEELERARLVRPLPQAANRPSSVGYQFIHDKIREVVLLDLSPARLRFMHRRVAQALEETLGAQAGQQAAVLARHFEAGGDLSGAFRYWIQAAERARQLFSTQEASSSYRRAENLLTALGSPPSEAQFYRLYAGWGELAEENGDLQTLDRVYSILRRLGEQLRSPLLLGTALSGLGSSMGATK